MGRRPDPPLQFAGPRYTSYPTAPQFHTDYRPEDWRDAMERGNTAQRPLSAYLHIPFCETVCYYCGCNKIITANRSRALPYLEALNREIQLQAQFVDTTRPLIQLHLGSGTPTYLSDEQLTSLLGQLRSTFRFADDQQGESSIEIHPQSVDPQRMVHLRRLGFNRLSLGIQDFNRDVQKAVNRFNSYEELLQLTQASRAERFKSISFDLIYELPRQTAATFAETLDQVIDLRPDQLSLFNYAHMPHLFKVQRQINAAELPEPQEKLRMLQHSIERLTQASYRYIGMDHFALPDDELSQAQTQGHLQRSFQGYSGIATS